MNEELNLDGHERVRLMIYMLDFLKKKKSLQFLSFHNM